MEPAQSALRFVIYSNVIKVEHKIRKQHVSGVGDKAIFREIDHGWWLHLRGSYEAIFVGLEEPPLRTDDKVKITIEKAHNV